MRFLILSSCFLLSSCISINNVQEVYTSPKETIATISNGSVVCKDVDIMDLVDYKIPEPGNIDAIPIGDRKGETKLLLEYISVLKSELRRLAKDYGCEVI